VSERRRKRSRLAWAVLAAVGFLTVVAVGLSGQAGAAPSAFPSVSISDASVTEGDSGSATMTFTVSVAPGATPSSKVDYATADGSATTADGDYAGTSGTLHFTTGGPTSQTVGVTVNGDTKVEPDETFSVNLSGAVDLSIVRGTGTGTIVNDDVPSISIGDATVTEGNAGTTTASFLVTLSTASFQTVSVGFSTSNGTATAGSDYTASSGTVTFTPGNTSQTVDVTVSGDTTVEPDETFGVNLSGASGATIADGSATGTIVNDDVASLSIGDTTVTEGDSGTTTASFPVTLSAASASAVAVDFATANGTAIAGSDYTTTSGTLTFNPGDLSKTIDVPIKGDTVFESTETFLVNLSNPVSATIADGSATGTIIDNDPEVGPDVSVVKSASPTALIVGGQVTFSILVTNNGTTPALNVVVTDSLPSGLDLVSIKSSSGSCAGTSCTIGTIQGGGGTSVTVVARANEVGRMVNTASVSTSPKDAATANNSAQAGVQVSEENLPPLPQLPAPSAGEVNVVPNGGSGQCVALKGQSCQPLETGQQFDIGDIAYINPGKGTVEMRGIEGIGTFFGTSFGVNEILPTSSSRTTSSARIERPVLVLKLLGGNFKPCKAKKAQLSYDGRSTQAATKRKPIRRLWGKGKGRFRTQGRYSAGTVRGTYWLTEDDCEGTLTRVVEGVVQVHDLVNGKYVNVRAGHTYFVKAGPLKKPKKKK
jgi:uncharacterized repeat protein (TIGR01451 family)